VRAAQAITFDGVNPSVDLPLMCAVQFERDDPSGPDQGGGYALYVPAERRVARSVDHPFGLRAPRTFSPLRHGLRSMTADMPTGRISAGTLEFPQSHGYALGGTRGPSRDSLCTRHTHRSERHTVTTGGKKKKARREQGRIELYFDEGALTEGIAFTDDEMGDILIKIDGDKKKK
jgi:hypothetical protein